MSDCFKLALSCFLGIIEGIMEFLPVSSTGHLILIESFLNYINDNSIQIFIIIIQLGSVLSILVIFRYRVHNIMVYCIPNMLMKQHHDNNHLCVKHICIGTIPGVICGVVYYEQISLLLLNPFCVVYGLVMGSILLLIGELNLFLSSQIKKNYILSCLDKITYLQVFLIGCFQCLAFLPGFSRSGATISGGLLVGLNRSVSSEFSFCLAVPIILGSIILTIYRHSIFISAIDVYMLIIGCVTVFIFSIFTMHFLLNVLNKISLIPFIIYRLLLAAGVYWKLTSV